MVNNLNKLRTLCLKDSKPGGGNGPQDEEEILDLARLNPTSLK
jgi:hypothetical protein